MGCFYCGFDWRNRKNGYFKIGETSYPTPAKRLSQIRSGDAFQCLGYIEMIDETKPQRLYVESYVRMKMAEYFNELTSIKNDHFTYQIIQGEKYPQAQKFADAAVNYAIDACNEQNILFKYGTKTFKR